MATPSCKLALLIKIGRKITKRDESKTEYKPQKQNNDLQTEKSNSMAILIATLITKREITVSNNNRFCKLWVVERLKG